MSYKVGDNFPISEIEDIDLLKRCEGSVVSGATLPSRLKIPSTEPGLEWMVENGKLVLREMTLEIFMEMRKKNKN